MEILIDCPILVTKVPEHSSIKPHVLAMISEFSNSSIISQNDRISKTDWDLEEFNRSAYLDLVKPIIIKHVSNNFRKYSSEGLAFGNFWFQQYEKNGTHDWHIHKFCHWTNVYFLELDDPNSKTEIQNFNRSRLIEYSAGEGDVISFPAFLYHRSPIITSGRKTVISFNSNSI